MVKEYQQMVESYEKNQDALFQKANVVGFGIGQKIKNGVDTGKKCITIMVSQKLDEGELRKEDIITSSDVDGIEIDVIETGEIFAGDKLKKKEEMEIQEINHQLFGDPDYLAWLYAASPICPLANASGL